jgi:8-oxo-dGTP diphosphatase
MYTYPYPRPMVCTDCIVIAPFDGIKKILLIKRGNDPYKGTWALPGGFVEMEEDLEDAAKRELAEETGINISSMKQFATYGKPGRDPRGRNISIVYYHISEKVLETSAGDDAAECRWFAINDLPELAFDHGEIIGDFFQRVISELLIR